LEPKTGAVANTRKVAATLRTPTGVGLALLITYSIVRNLAAASAAPLWYDEILTWTVSSQISWARILKALMEGVDGQPFLFYVIEHAFLRIVANREIALRLPSILAFPVTLGCIFFYARRRAGDTAALLAAIFLFTTVLFYDYAVDARPYSMVVACFAIALICYQRTSKPYWVVGLALALSLGEALHYYALFCVLPFGAAELVYFLRERKVRWRVWVALACPLVPLILAWRIAANFKAMYGAHFWSQYGFRDIAATYGGFLVNNAPFGTFIAIVCVSIILRAFFFRGKQTGHCEDRTEAYMEGVLLLALLALPVTTFLATKVLHGAMLDRYVLPTILGIALAIGYTRMVLTPLLILVLFASALLIGGREILFWRSVNLYGADRFALADEAFIEQAGHADLPVVVTDAHLFLPLALYASPRYPQRLVYVVDQTKALQYLHWDTIDKNLVPLRNYVSFSMPDFREFAKTHPQFLLLTSDPESPYGWCLDDLRANALSVELLEGSKNRKLYFFKLRSSM